MQVPGHDPRRDVLARAGGGHRRADGRRAPQGVRPPRPGDHPADLDDRVAPAPRARAWPSHRPRRSASACRPPGRPTRSRCAASATPRPTTRPPRAPSTRRAASPTSTCPLPLLFVCEDNGLGISVRTPPGWIEAAYGTPAAPALVRGRRHGPVAHVRRRGATRPTGSAPSGAGVPAPAHRALLAHAGTDVEAAYRSPAEIRADYARDPILGTAALLVEPAWRRPTALVHHYERIARRGARAGRGVRARAPS